MHVSLLTLILVAALGKTKAVAPEPDVQPAREIVVDEKKVGKVHHIRTARGVVTTVEFPEDLMEAPKCGDCADGTGGGALSRMEWNAQGRYLTIWPNTVPVEAVVLCEGENPQGPYEVTGSGEFSFTGIGVGEGGHVGLRPVDGVVESGTDFVVYVSAAAVW